MILAIDIGSTGIRALLITREGSIAASAYRRITQSFPRLGWLEHDLDDIWTQCLAVCRGVLSDNGVDTNCIKAMAISTQRNTLAIWDRHSGRPLLPAISWSDNRTQELYQSLSERDKSDCFLKRSGLKLTTRNLGLKLRWVMDSDSGIKGSLLSESALWGTLDSWLVWKLTSGMIWATDYSNASTTGIFDLIDCAWSDKLMRMLDLPEMPLPEVRPTIDEYGETREELFGHAIPISCVTGDQYASLFGQGCVHPGMAKCTLGTGGFFVVNIGSRPDQHIEGIFTRLCWHLGDDPIYGLEGAIYHVGTLLEWLCNRMGLAESVEKSAEAAAEAESRGVYVVPAFSGLASPYWDPGAKAILVGPSLNTGPAELIRAGLEAVAFQLQDIVQAMKNSLPREGLRLRFDGNVAMNDTLMQIVADQLQTAVERSSSFGHRSALGAAYLAGIHSGMWHGLDEVAAMWQPDRVFYPEKPASETEALYQGWRDAVCRSRGLTIGEKTEKK